jgi:hypothetical protein
MGENGKVRPSKPLPKIFLVTSVTDPRFLFVSLRLGPLRPPCVLSHLSRLGADINPVWTLPPHEQQTLTMVRFGLYNDTNTMP